MGILNWIKSRKGKREFERTFTKLKKVGEINSSAKKTYELLAQLDFGTSDDRSDQLISELKNVQFSSNTNAVFYFYFPIVTHILHYKPKYEKELLSYLIGPNFANGDTQTKDLIKIIPGAMRYKLSENKHYLTKASQEWILNEFPKMEKEVEREVQKCWKELEE